MLNRFIITLDIDWAPDFVVDEVAEMLIAAGVCATWFVTHASPAVERLAGRPDLFELGIHPNFLPNSTQGRSPEEVLDYMCDVVSLPLSVRTHALVQSTPLLGLMFGRIPSLMADVSLFMPHAKEVEPVRFDFDGAYGIRFPYVWEDDLEMYRPHPIWRMANLKMPNGFCILDFHPIHVVLNDPTMNSYSVLRKEFPTLNLASREKVDGLRKIGDGPRRMFEDVLCASKAQGGGGRISDLLVDYSNGARGSSL